MTGQTVIRVLLPIVSALGAFFGTVFGLVKLLPERAAIINKYHLEIIERLISENKAQAEQMAHLELEIAELRGELNVQRAKDSSTHL